MRSLSKAQVDLPAQANLMRGIDNQTERMVTTKVYSHWGSVDERWLPTDEVPLEETGIYLQKLHSRASAITRWCRHRRVGRLMPIRRWYFPARRFNDGAPHRSKDR